MNERDAMVEQRADETSDDGPLDRDAMRHGNEHLAAGVGLGALSIGGVVLLGVSCPLCVVAVPALIGSGLWKRHKARRKQESARFELNWSSADGS
jgi:hypothetical protein